jgi:hypothetical protein
MFLTVFALVASACGGADPPPSANPPAESPSEPAGGDVAASCIAGFNWNGRFYARDAGELERPLEVGAPLGRGIQPGCNDTGGDADPDQEVTVYRIKGVDPELAVTTLGDAAHAYFNTMPAS